MRRVLFMVAAVVVPASALSIGMGGTAWAGGGTKCSALTANVSSPTGTLSGCTDPANTGGSGTFPIASLIGGSATITWATGGTTSLSGSATAVTKDEKEKQGCPAGTTEYALKGKVTGSTGVGSSVKGKVKGELCLDSAGNVTLEPGTTLKL